MVHKIETSNHHFKTISLFVYDPEIIIQDIFEVHVL